ncbi:phosphate/phosphite/phosphonate ABC transporter substrate-binding protein [Thermodesulfobacteriota bacterium]
MRKSLLIRVFLLVAILISNSAYAEIKIGLLAKRGPEVARERWTVLAEYLEEKLAEPVRFIPLDFTEIMDFCRKNPTQFIFANSWFYVRAKVKQGAKALVTIKNRGSGTLFGGVIFTRKGVGVDDLRDIRGRTLACPKLSSAGGWIFQKGVMVKGGVHPTSECKLVLQLGTHDAVVKAVRDRQVDVGTVRTNILERMHSEGKVKLSDLAVLHPVRHEGFPELCSTPLYPTWPIASLKDTPPELAEKLKKCLLAIPKRSVALDPCNVEAFVEAHDYGPLEELLRFLKVKPFDSSP